MKHTQHLNISCFFVWKSMNNVIPSFRNRSESLKCQKHIFHGKAERLQRKCSKISFLLSFLLLQFCTLSPASIRSGQLAVFPELWISVSSQIHGTLVSRTIYARSVGLHFFLLYQGSQCHSAAFCQSQSENIDTHNNWRIFAVQPFSQSNIFEDGLQPTVFVENFKNERVF